MSAPNALIRGTLARGIQLGEFQGGRLTTARFSDKNPQAAAVAIGKLLDASDDRTSWAPGLKEESTGLESHCPLAGREVEQLKFALYQDGMAERSQEGLNFLLELAE